MLLLLFKRRCLLTPLDFVRPLLFDKFLLGRKKFLEGAKIIIVEYLLNLKCAFFLSFQGESSCC